MRRAALGAACGFTCGYAAVRALQALRGLRAPAAPRARRDPRSYGAARRALALAGVVRSVAASATVAFVLADPLDRRLRSLPRPLRAPAFALVLVGLDALLEAGPDFVEGHLLERRYGNSAQQPCGWLADHLKGTAVTALVSVVLAGLADALVVRAPRRWPLIALGATPPLLALATVIVPALVLPLFNTYAPVTGELERRVRALAGRHGVGGAAILRFDMSRRTRKANAFVTGVLGTERIAIADTLIDAFEADETLFVVAHELGHYVRRDPWLGIAIGSVAAAATLLPADAILRATTRRGLSSPAQAARLAFYALLIQLLLTPPANAASRALERRADRFALAATGDAAAGARAFRRLAERNLAELDPPRWAQIVFGSHPSLGTRIRLLER